MKLVVSKYVRDWLEMRAFDLKRRWWELRGKDPVEELEKEMEKL